MSDTRCPRCNVAVTHRHCERCRAYVSFPPFHCRECSKILCAECEQAGCCGNTPALEDDLSDARIPKGGTP